MSVAVNGVMVDGSSGTNPELAAVRELLRQRAMATGLLAADTADAGPIDHAIETLLGREVQVPTPTEAECRRHYDAHRERFRSGDLVCARHILFQVTQSVPVPTIRARAEQTLAEVLLEPDRFDKFARELSNCPSGQQGGSLGQLSRGDTVPEFEQALFRTGPTGILRELVKSRYGFHIVAVDERIAGEVLPFDAVRERIAEYLASQVEQRALRQYVSFLAGQAEVSGVDLNAASSPPVQ